MHTLNSPLHDHQEHLELMFNKNQLIPRIRREFADSEDFDFAGYIAECGIDPLFGMDVLVQMALHKRASLQTLVGVLRHHFEDSQKTADELLKAAEADLVDWDGVTGLFIVKFTISDDVQAELDMFQFPLPMIIEPLPVRTNKETGYLTGSGSIILRNNHHMDDVCLDHINRMNRIRFTINNDTAQMVKNKWRNLDKAKPGESKDEFKRRQRAFEKYDRNAREVMALMPDYFHLTHKYDKRGRIYCQGYHITYQGAPWNKAVIEFADQEITNAA